MIWPKRYQPNKCSFSVFHYIYIYVCAKLYQKIDCKRYSNLYSMISPGFIELTDRDELKDLYTNQKKTMSPTLFGLIPSQRSNLYQVQNTIRVKKNTLQHNLVSHNPNRHQTTKNVLCLFNFLFSSLNQIYGYVACNL